MNKPLSIMTKIITIFFLITKANEANAHGDLKSIEGECLLKIGSETVKLTGYQPLISNSKFCEDIPKLSNVIITLDLTSLLRDMWIDIRFVKDINQSDIHYKEDELTVYYAPPREYKTGTITLEHSFSETGKYLGFVRARKEDGTLDLLSIFPFQVGEKETNGENVDSGIIKQKIQLPSNVDPSTIIKVEIVSGDSEGIPFQRAYLQSRVDEITINKVIFNRGNCDTGLQFGKNTLKFGDTKIVASLMCTIAEIEIETSMGSFKYSIQ